MLIDVTTWHLEMHSPADLRPKRSARSDLALARVPIPRPELNRFFYTAVGGPWYWIDRLGWTWQQWLDYLARPEMETWVLSAAGLPAGYFELESQPGGSVEIAYFGLLPHMIGQGLGGHLLTAAVERTWASGARRVWVHTCSLDYPHALAGYQARGFAIFRQEVARKELPPHPPGPWPGAHPPAGASAE